MAAKVAMSALSGGGKQSPNMQRSAFSDRSPINIAPSAVNLGEILKPFKQGSTANGGYGLQTPSRYLSDNNGQIEQYQPVSLGEQDEGDGIGMPLILIAGAGIIGIVVWRKYM
jgi:hypothetical protein